MGSKAHVAASAVLFMASAGLALLGVRFLLDRAGGAWALPIALVFVGAGAMTWSARGGNDLHPGRRLMLVVGAMGMNIGVCIVNLGLSSAAGTEGARTVVRIIYVLAALNVVFLLVVTKSRQWPKFSDSDG